MTVIAAIATDDRVIMGTDSAAGGDGLYIYKNEGKVVPITADDGGLVLIAAAGNAAIFSVVKRDLRIDATPARDASDEEADEWATVVAQAITGILADCTPPLLSSADGDSASLDGALMLACGRHVWLLFTHSVIRPSDGVLAIGSGGHIALGALHAATEHGAKPSVAVRDAVDIACKYADGCGVDDRGPLVYTTMP